MCRGWIEPSIGEIVLGDGDDCPACRFYCQISALTAGLSPCFDSSQQA